MPDFSYGSISGSIVRCIVGCTLTVVSRKPFLPASTQLALLGKVTMWTDFLVRSPGQFQLFNHLGTLSKPGPCEDLKIPSFQKFLTFPSLLASLFRIPGFGPIHTQPLLLFLSHLCFLLLFPFLFLLLLFPSSWSS